MLSTVTIALLAGIVLVLVGPIIACRKAARAAAADERAERRAHYVKKAVRAEERAAWLRGLGRDNIAVDYERDAARWRDAAAAAQ